MKRQNKLFFIFIFETLLSCLSLTVVMPAQAFELSEKICQEYGLGNNWYCQSEKTEEQVMPEDIFNSELPPEVKAEVLGAYWDKNRKKAVMTGKREDIDLFLKYQHAIAKQGVDFARKAQALAESTPVFANTESTYKNISVSAVQDAERQYVLQNNKKRYALVFVYRTGCPYCVRQLPIVQEFGRLTGYRILGVTPDKEQFSELPENVTDPYIGQDPSILSFPTLLLLDVKMGKKIFISKGVTTLDDIERLVLDRMIEIERIENAQSQ